jgi:formylglycine-generating enzyme required for sulfatase activity
MQLQTEQDTTAYQSASNENTPEAFRYYLDHCNIICAQRQAAQKNLKRSEQTARAVQQDSQYYAQARKYGTVPALAAYLSSCKECRDIAQFDQHWDKQQLAELPVDALRRMAQFNKSSTTVGSPKPSKKSVTQQAKVIAPEIKKQVAAAKPKEKSKQAVIAAELAKKEQLAGKMIMLKPGCFQMGSNNGSRDEKPVHKVCLTRSYELGQYEVTQAQWQAVMGKNPAYFNGADRPVEAVSWYDVQNFIAKLNQKTGLSYRLPTEAEWEYACRAGTRKEYCGDDVNSIAWYEGNSNGRTHAVGLKQANSLGFHDMSGNVWEWVEDRYDENYYGSSPSNDPTGATKTPSRVYRGGSWYNGASFSRATNRDYDSPSNRDRNLGFRLARTL